MALNRDPERYSWQAFGSCEEAFIALDLGKKPDVVLLDVELPGMDGIQGIQHFKKIIPDVSLLILTVFEEDEKIFRAICAGASGYLLKSQPIKNITHAIDQVIEGGAPMNPHIVKRVMDMFSKMAPSKKDFGLTAREQAVLELMGEGFSKKEIADKLDLSRHTVNNFVRFVYRKLHVHCQTAAVSVAMRSGLINLNH